MNVAQNVPDVGKLEQREFGDGTPIWRMKSVVMTICKFCHVSENALYQEITV